MIRVRTNCKFPKNKINMQKLTHLRISLSQMTKLPNFLGNLTQFNQALITSKELSKLTGEFGIKETKFRLELRVNERCLLSESLNKLENLTHLQITDIAAKDLPKSWENFKNLAYIRWINPPLYKIPELIKNLPKIKCLHISFGGSQDFRENFWEDNKNNRLEISILHKKPIQFSNSQNLIHLRVSGSRVSSFFDLSESNFDKITYVRIDNNNYFPYFVKECKNLMYLEVNTEFIEQIPRDLMHFKQIQQLIITAKFIEFSNDFWNSKDICTFKIKVKPNCKFPDFLHELSNLTHLWIELPELRILTEDFKKFKENNIDLRIYTDKEIDISLEDYLTLFNPKFYIIKVAPNCSIPESLN